MAKKKTQKKANQSLDKRSQKIVLGAVIVAALGALAVIILTAPTNQSQNGVGADGFSVFEKKGADLDVSSVVSKASVVSALGATVQSVDDVSNSGVMSFNNNLGQTATYNFTATDGTKGWIDIDLLRYQSQAAYDSDDVFKGTGDAGKVNGMEVRYLPAASIGMEREYALLVTNGLDSYKFSMSQPTSRIVIREYKAQEILKNLISTAKL